MSPPTTAICMYLLAALCNDAIFVVAVDNEPPCVETVLCNDAILVVAVESVLV